MNPKKLKLMCEGGKAKPFADWVADYAPRMVELLQARNNLTRDDLEYLAETAVKLKDERLKGCIAVLIGWGDDERAELETFMAIALEVMKRTPPSRLRDAAMTVNIKVAMRENEEAQQAAAAEALAAASRAVTARGASIDTAQDSRCAYLSHAGHLCNKCGRMHDGLPFARFRCIDCDMVFNDHEHTGEGDAEGRCPSCGSTNTRARKGL